MHKCTNELILYSLNSPSLCVLGTFVGFFLPIKKIDVFSFNNKQVKSKRFRSHDENLCF